MKCHWLFIITVFAFASCSESTTPVSSFDYIRASKHIFEDSTVISTFTISHSKEYSDSIASLYPIDSVVHIGASKNSGDSLHELLIENLIARKFGVGNGDPEYSSHRKLFDDNPDILFLKQTIKADSTKEQLWAFYLNDENKHKLEEFAVSLRQEGFETENIEKTDEGFKLEFLENKRCNSTTLIQRIESLNDMATGFKLGPISDVQWRGRFSIL